MMAFDYDAEYRYTKYRILCHYDNFLDDTSYE